MAFLNAWSDTLWIAGVPYAPGAVIPASADPAQLAYFEAQGVVKPTTAPASPSDPLRRVASSPVKEEPDADNGAE